MPPETDGVERRHSYDRELAQMMSRLYRYLMQMPAMVVRSRDHGHFVHLDVD